MYKQMLKKQKQIEGQINRKVKDESRYSNRKLKIDLCIDRQMLKIQKQIEGWINRQVKDESGYR